MDYVADHGVWSDFPFERVERDFKEFYPASVYDADARAAMDREIKAEQSAFENERPIG